MSQPGSGWPPCYGFFFGQLTGVINAGRGKWKAKCPAHEDKVQSLSVRVGNKGQLWVRCHAGGLCSLSAIVRAAGAEMDDLFPDNKRYTNTRGKPHMDRGEISYQYRDEKGELLFEAVRREPKSFRQRRPNPDFDSTRPASKDNPEYLYNLEGVRRVLFRLPQLIAALAKTPDKAVFVVEGEKDVMSADALGIIATTNPMGAGKWQPEYAQQLKGANVVVIPDNDEPGKAHARTVCDSLKGVAKTVRYVELPGVPDKGDLTDWLEKTPGTAKEKKEELGKLIKAAKLWGGGSVTPSIVPGGTTAAASPEPPAAAPAAAQPPAPDPVPNPDPPKTEPPKPAPVAAATDAEAAEKFPNSPTIRAAAGLPNPQPGTVPGWPDGSPAAVPIDPPKVEAPKPEPAPIPADRAARVAQWFKDVKATASALKLAGSQIRSVTEFYGAVKLTVAMMDQTFSLADGTPKLDGNMMGQLSLLFGAYLVQAAADFGIGCGIMPPEEAKEVKEK